MQGRLEVHTALAHLCLTQASWEENSPSGPLQNEMEPLSLLPRLREGENVLPGILAACSPFQGPARHQ